MESQAWAPSLKNAFRLIFAVRCAAALYSIISDCDEVFNYWEPTHWLQYGYGLQTWEYSPEFTIRSWSYVSVHAVLGWIGSWFAKSKVSARGLHSEKDRQPTKPIVFRFKSFIS